MANAMANLPQIIKPALPLLPRGTVDVALYSNIRVLQQHVEIIAALFQVQAQAHPLPEIFSQRYALVVPAASDVTAIRRAIFRRGEVR